MSTEHETTETKQERRENRRRKKQRKMPKHGYTLSEIYQNTVLKRIARQRW